MHPFFQSANTNSYCHHFLVRFSNNNETAPLLLTSWISFSSFPCNPSKCMTQTVMPWCEFLVDKAMHMPQKGCVEMAMQQRPGCTARWDAVSIGSFNYQASFMLKISSELFAEAPSHMYCCSQDLAIHLILNDIVKVKGRVCKIGWRPQDMIKCLASPLTYKQMKQ